MAHWSKSQSNVALSSAEAELNATVRGLSELIALYHLIEETQRVTVSLAIHTDASACKGMLLRHGAGKVKHLSVKQLWSQECVKMYAVDVKKVPRQENPSDVLTHCVSHPIMEKQLSRMNVSRGKQCKGDRTKRTKAAECVTHQCDIYGVTVGGAWRNARHSTTAQSWGERERVTRPAPQGRDGDDGRKADGDDGR